MFIYTYVFSFCEFVELFLRCATHSDAVVNSFFYSTCSLLFHSKYFVRTLEMRPNRTSAVYQLAIAHILLSTYIYGCSMHTYNPQVYPNIIIIYTCARWRFNPNINTLSHTHAGTQIIYMHISAWLSSEFCLYCCCCWFAIL